MTRIQALARLGIHPKVCEHLAKRAQDGEDPSPPAAEDNELLLYGPIVDEGERSFYAEWFDDDSMVSSMSVKARLAEITGDVVLRINSPGGSYWEGAAIHGFLLDLRNSGRNLTARIDGLAASAATFVMLAAKTITAAPLAELMIHRAQGFQIGTGKEFREMADFLDSTDEQIADLYAARTGEGRDKMLAEMDREAWYTAPSAKELGLIDDILAADPGEDMQEKAARMFAQRNRRLASLAGIT